MKYLNENLYLEGCKWSLFQSQRVRIDFLDYRQYEALANHIKSFLKTLKWKDCNIGEGRCVYSINSFLQMNEYRIRFHFNLKPKKYKTHKTSCSESTIKTITQGINVSIRTYYYSYKFLFNSFNVGVIIYKI